MSAGDADATFVDKCAKINLSPRTVAYLETLLNRVRIHSGYGSVTIRIEKGRIHTTECMVSEVMPEDCRI